MSIVLTTPFEKEKLKTLKAGDAVLISGEIFSARDEAHKRMDEALNRGEELPFCLKGTAVYYMGPSPARPGQVIGSAGPTTSGRMDRYTPRLLDLGLSAMIGKGKRSEEVREAMKRNGAVYFAAVGGAGALLSRCILSSEVIAYEDLGTEAIRRLEVRDFPCIVVFDAAGHDRYFLS